MNRFLNEIRKASSKDNFKRLDLWVKTSDLKGYSIVKGLKSFTILTQKGELPKVANPSRERVGLWLDYIGFLRKISIRINNEDVFKKCVKYVSGYGFVGYQYSSENYDVTRLDYVHYYSPTYYVVLRNFGSRSSYLEFSFKPEVRFMWPLNEVYENLEYRVVNGKFLILWSSGSKGALAVGCLPKEKCSLSTRKGSFSYKVDIKPNDYIVFAFSPNYSEKEALSELARATKEWYGDFERTYEVYRRIAYDTLSVRIGNFSFEKAFIWAKISTFMLYSETSIGNGWFAGAPVFSWFFGRDSAWTGFAVLSLGFVDNVWEQIMLLAKFQSNEGQVPHEVVLIPEIGSNIRTGYMSIDSTILWIILLKELYNWSLNKDFIVKNYESLVKAYRFLRKVCDVDDDLFLENQLEKLLIGWPERWASKRRGKCVEINSYWIEALRSISFLAKTVSDTGLSRETEKYAKRLKEKFDSIFWDDKLNYYRDHVNNQNPITIFPIMPLYYKLARKDRALKVLERLKREDFRTPWGLRSVSSNDPLYDGGYHSGAIWPLHTGWVIVASLNYGDVDFAREMLNTLIEFTFKSSDPGRINEVYSDVDGSEMGQFIQAWSSAALIHAITNGFFRIRPKPNDNEVEITVYPLAYKMSVSKINVWNNMLNIIVDFEKRKVIIECIKCSKLKLKFKIFFDNRFYERKAIVEENTVLTF